MSKDPTLPNSEYQQALDFLVGRINYERVSHMPYRKYELKLTRMQRLLDLIGNPESQLRCIHVAGTKGKGSTCAILASILKCGGYRVGLFTSPHLERVEERFCVDGKECTESQFVELVQSVTDAVKTIDAESSNGPTYFEITTAIAMLHFSRSQVDLAILEVGLGGRLDSTNVCHPIICLITSISFDHMRQLGNTLTKIAGEKAGIIKRGVPVVSGVQNDEPCQVIQDRAERRDAPLFEIGRHFNVEFAESTSNFHYQVQSEPFVSLSDLHVNLLGRHQAFNASLAIATCQLISQQGFPVGEPAIREGLQKVACLVRVEKVLDSPATIVDSAHNVASIEALLQAVRGYNNKRILIFATTIDKDFQGMLDRLLPEFDRILLTRYQDNPRGVEPQELLQACVSAGRSRKLGIDHVAISDHPETAWHAAEELAGPDGFICITGSFFIAAEVRRSLSASHLGRLSLGGK